VTRSNIGEVAKVDCSYRDNRQSLADRDYGSIGAAKTPVREAPHEFGHASQVGVHQLHKLERVVRPHAHTVQECRFRRGPKVLVDWNELEQLATGHGLPDRTMDAMFDAVLGYRVRRRAAAADSATPPCRAQADARPLPWMRAKLAEPTEADT
jgi:hypothetical protein